MNVEYKCLDEEYGCGIRHFAPPGRNPKCPNTGVHDRHPDVRLTQTEEFNGPDSLWVDEDGKTDSKGHIPTAGAQHQPPSKWQERPMDERDLTADLYTHSTEDGTFQGSHMRDGLNLDGLTVEQIEQVNAHILALRAQDYERTTGQGIDGKIGPEGAVVENPPPHVTAKNEQGGNEGYIDQHHPGHVTEQDEVGHIAYQGPTLTEGEIDQIRQSDTEAEYHDLPGTEERMELLRAEWREVTGTEPDGRYGERRLYQELQKEKGERGLLVTEEDDSSGDANQTPAGDPDYNPNDPQGHEDGHEDGRSEDTEANERSAVHAADDDADDGGVDDDVPEGQVVDEVPDEDEAGTSKGKKNK